MFTIGTLKTPIYTSVLKNTFRIRKHLISSTLFMMIFEVSKKNLEGDFLFVAIYCRVEISKKNIEFL